MKNLWKEFKAFITRGNVLDMAVGVVIGGAFSAIVTSLVNILLSICTWGVPGGLKGLVSVLPAAYATQKGPVGQKFLTSDLVQKTIDFAKLNGADITVTDATYMQWQNSLLGKYTLHGGTYTYNLAAVIDWGSFINAIITFIIIAITLFIIVKVASYSAKKRAMLKDIEARAADKKAKGLPLSKKEQAALEEKEARDAAAKAEAEAAAAAAEEAAKPDPMIVLLTEIRDQLKANNLEK